MKIHVGYWSFDPHEPEESYTCDSFFKLLMYLLPKVDRRDPGYYSISFSIGDR